MEGCDICGEFGCCEDGLTPALGPEHQGCGCEASQYGCCLDGSEARGEHFLGCDLIPGEHCDQPSVTGSCTDYTDKWFYDMEYGGCSRFWYGGCDPGHNHFDSEAECNEDCVSPRGSALCFLPPVAGPCKEDYNEWYYDAQTKICR